MSSTTSQYSSTFHLLFNKGNVEEYWLVVDDMTVILLISTQEKNQLVKIKGF